MKKLAILFIVALSATAVKGINDGLGTDSLATNYVTQNSSKKDFPVYSNWFLTKTDADGQKSVPWIRITIFCLFLILAGYLLYRICLDDYLDSGSDYDFGVGETISAILARGFIFNVMVGFVFWCCFSFSNPAIPIIYTRIILWVGRYVVILLVCFIFYLINYTDLIDKIKSKLTKNKKYQIDEKPNSIIDSEAGSETLDR